jgi:hypothetical protein
MNQITAPLAHIIKHLMSMTKIVTPETAAAAKWHHGVETCSIKRNQETWGQWTASDSWDRLMSSGSKNPKTKSLATNCNHVERSEEVPRTELTAEDKIGSRACHKKRKSADQPAWHENRAWATTTRRKLEKTRN